MQAIAYLESPFKEKFGLPRQPGLIKSVYAYIAMTPTYSNPDAFKGITGYSHLWIQFLFHEVPEQNEFKPMVRPPRLGGNEKIGVFACRSPFRPNRLGLSLVELKGIEQDNDQLRLKIACPDILDGTPILDIKPYIPYADSAHNAVCELASQAPEKRLQVSFSSRALETLRKLEAEQDTYSQLASLIDETVSYDPRPAYKSAIDNKEYGLRLFDLDVKWVVNEDIATIVDIVRI